VKCWNVFERSYCNYALQAERLDRRCSENVECGVRIDRHCPRCFTAACRLQFRKVFIPTLIWKLKKTIYHGRDVFAVLPTGYGKSEIFHLLPSLFLVKVNCERGAAYPVVIVVLSRNVLIKAAILNVRNKTANSEDLGLDFGDANQPTSRS